MLLVPASVMQSKIHGLGLFAVEPIQKGTVVWRFDKLFDITFRPTDVEKLPSVQKATVKYYAYLSKESGNYIFSGDDYRFINHSAENNLDSKSETGAVEWCDVANRDIAPGEELTVNYLTFDAEPPSSI